MKKDTNIPVVRMIRVEKGGTVLICKVTKNSPAWKLPGGNTNVGEDKINTGLRERTEDEHR